MVVSQKDNLPVYTVKPEHHNGPTRTLHRDLLLPCGFLPTVPENPPAVQEKPRRANTRQHPITDPDEQDYDSEEGDNYPLYYPSSPLRELSRSFEEYRVIFPLNTHSNPAVEQPKSGNAQVSEPARPPERVDAPRETGSEVSASHDEPGNATLPDNDPLETENVPEPAREEEPKTQLGEMDSAPDSNEEKSQTHIEMNEDPSVNKEHDPEAEQALRRSSRERLKPKLLTYPELGNPLVSIVQSLFQSLSDAVTNTIEGHEIKVV